MAAAKLNPKRFAELVRIKRRELDGAASRSMPYPKRKAKPKRK
jgi:hypothetical protein